MNLRTAALATLLFSSAASARELVVNLPAEVGSGLDLVLTDRVIHAAYGIGRGEDGVISRSAPLLLGEWFRVLDRDGNLHRMRVRGVWSERAVVELQSPTEVDAPEQAPNARAAGVYRATGCKVDGWVGQPCHEDMVLGADGSYRFGQAKGRYQAADGRVLLEGYYAAWGPAAVEEDGARLTFRFRRGSVEMEVAFTREGGGSPALAQAR
jgi:hypothetical protein